MEWFRKLLAQIREHWGKWTILQRVILLGVVVLIIVGIAAMVSISSSPSMVPVIDAPIRDEAAQD
ncbi:MAG: flagellar M-ring protein FliF, partial [Treponema sp.]|nr:flagellar M-ring protein FliF [Treponema sp.]